MWAEELVEVAAKQLGSEARGELLNRGVSDDQIRQYQIGYLDRELPSGLPQHFLDWAKEGAKLDDVFLLPLTSATGEIKGFQFRHVERERTGYMDYFLDRREAGLFGLAQAVPHMYATRSAFIVEGGFDLLPIQRVYAPTVATLTAWMNKQTFRVLRRLVDRLYVGYDNDVPGRKGCELIKENYDGPGFQVYIVAYPKVKMANGKLVKDPAELWETWGDAQLAPFIRSVTQESVF
jgi:DNA primase